MSQLEDSEDKIIERLGDCDIPVDYMDLLTHRVRCRKIEIFHYDDVVSFTDNNEEEEQELSYGPLFSEDFTDDEDRALQMVGDIDCLIRRIEKMQLIIRRRKVDRQLNEVSEASTQQLEEQKLKQQNQPKDLQEQKKAQVLLSCDELWDVRNLQQSHHILQCEIDEMICNYRLMRELIWNMRDQVCRENRSLRRLGTQSLDYLTWSSSVTDEMSVCRTRYRRLLEKKISKDEAQRVINTHVKKTQKRNKSFLTRSQLHYELREFNLEIDELLEYADDLRKEMARRFATFAHKSKEHDVARSEISSITGITNNSRTSDAKKNK